MALAKKLTQKLPIASVFRRFTTKSCVVDTQVCQMTASGPLPVTNTLEIKDPASNDKWPVFRLLDPSGDLVGAEPSLTKEQGVEMYKMMGKIQAVDDIFFNAQRQGRISFYMQNTGEEAIHIGSASALSPNDMILAQYRELGVLLWRGFSVQQCAHQCFSNDMDWGKGRQMPVHYGSNTHNFQTISSPLATQLPQAVGVGYALKLQAKLENKELDTLTICYFGEGTASEGDFHAALNFSATLESPVIFFCRNNGFAISTPVKDQFRGDGIVSRAAGYGIPAIRVDGNDLLAVREATLAARALSLSRCGPVLIEAMTYRRGHHSTSDDSTRYRDPSEVKAYADQYDAATRFRRFLEKKGWWSEEEESTMRTTQRDEVMQAMETAENRPKPHHSMLFEDVYADMPWNLKEQEKEMLSMAEKYPEHYSNNAGH